MVTALLGEVLPAIRTHNNLPLLIDVYNCYPWMRLTVPPRIYWNAEKVKNNSIHYRRVVLFLPKTFVLDRLGNTKSNLQMSFNVYQG